MPPRQSGYRRNSVFLWWGMSLYMGLGTKVYRAIPNDTRAGEVLRPLLKDKLHTIQKIKEMVAELMSIAPKKSKNFFQNAERMMIPLEDTAWDVEEDAAVPHSLDYRFDFILPFSSEEVQFPSEDAGVAEFISDLCGEKEDMILRLQMSLAAILLNVNLGLIFYLVGGEGNGRVILMQLLEEAVGHHNVANLSFSDMAKNFRLPYAVGRHSIISFEEGNQMLSEINTIKKMAQGVGLNTDKKYGDAFDFVSNSPIYCGGDDLPNVAHGRLEKLEHQLKIIRLVPSLQIDFLTQRKLRKNLNGFRSWLWKGASLLAQNGFCIHEAQGCRMEDSLEQIDAFLDSYVCEAPGNNIFSRSITEAYRVHKGLEEVSPAERVQLHGALQNNFDLPLEKSVRKGREVSSGYSGIDVTRDPYEKEPGQRPVSHLRVIESEQEED